MARLADRQHGVVAFRQLIELGYAPGAIQRLIEAGLLHPVHKGVYAVGRPSLTPNGHRMAAVLSCKPPAFLSHFSAAALWEIWSSRARHDVTVLRKRANLAKVRVHYASALDPEDTTIKDGIPVTSPSRTLLDLAAALNPDRLRKALEEAARQRLFDLLALDRAIARTPRRRGVRRLQTALTLYRDPPDTRSKLEVAFWELIRDAGIPEPQVNVLVAGLQVDFFWPGPRLVVELDSRRYHMSPHEFENDRVRDAKLLRADCRVLRVTHARMRDDRAQLLEDVRVLATPPPASPRAGRQPHGRRPGTA